MKQQFNCLIADDEPIARQIIETYCNHLPDLKIVASCATAFEAKTFLQSHTIDILFLDINMPVLDGVSFLKTLKNPPQVIFTTAYKEYAIDAFDLAACDYLLKPFSLERFLIAVDKAILASKKPVPITSQEAEESNFIFIKSEGKIYKLFYSDILYTEANGNYTKFVTKSQQLMSAMTLTSAEELLPKSFFIRVHRSFIINKSRIGHIEGNIVRIGIAEIPIGSNYRADFLKEIGMQ
jgi:DNA-binding LytR/AlgR family response regulator